MKSKLTSNLIVLGLIAMLGFFVFLTPHCAATTVWSDNFDDGDYDGWILLLGDFNMTSNTLEGFDGQDNVIYHNSSIAYGTWSFDVHLTNNTREYPLIFFITNDTGNPQPPSVTDDEFPRNSVFFSIHWDPSYVDNLFAGFNKMENGNQISLSWNSWNVSGYLTPQWIHVDITRDPTGTVNAYVDGVHHVGPIPIYNASTSFDFTTSNYFTVYINGDVALDNITVSDTIDITTIPPIPGFPTVTVIIGLFVGLGTVIFYRHRHRHR